MLGSSESLVALISVLNLALHETEASQRVCNKGWTGKTKIKLPKRPINVKCSPASTAKQHITLV